MTVVKMFIVCSDSKKITYLHLQNSSFVFCTNLLKIYVSAFDVKHPSLYI